MTFHRSSLTSVCNGLRRVYRTAIPMRQGWFVACDVRTVPFVPWCADCLAPTRQGRRVSNRYHPSGVIVPYCDTCLSRVNRVRVQGLAWRLGSVLLGLVATAFVPMLPWLSRAAAMVLAIFVTGLPWVAYVVAQIFTRSPNESRSVIPTETGLICLREQWASRLALQLGSTVVQKRVSAPEVLHWTSGGIVVVMLLSPWLYNAFHPQVRLLNLTDDTLVFLADNHSLAKLEPTSSESPKAGVLLRVASGERQMEARRVDGTPVEKLKVNLLLGHTHLFVPSRPKNTCFWIEYVEVGRASDERPRVLPLGESQDFWVLPADVDNWFNPALRSEPAHGTGGVVTSLRQGACSPLDE